MKTSLKVMSALSAAISFSILFACPLTAAAHYEVWRNTVNSVASAQRVADFITATTWDDTGVAQGTTYYYWVRVRTVSTVGTWTFVPQDLRYVTNWLTCPTSAKRGATIEVRASTDFNFANPNAFTLNSALRESDPLLDSTMTSWSASVFVSYPWTRVSASKEIDIGAWESDSTAEVYGRGVVPTSLGSVTVDTPIVNVTLMDLWNVSPGSVQASDGTYTDRIRVTWSSATGNSDFSSGDAGTATCLLPGIPSTIDASDGSHCGFIRITWSPVSGATGFEVMRDGAVVGSPSASPFDDYPGDGNPHSYRVRAKNACGTGGQSAPNSGNAGTIPNAPTGLSAGNGTRCGYVRVTWDAAPGASSYQVLRDGGVAGTVTGTSYDDYPGDTLNHSYTVKASNNCGTSGPSGPNSGYAGSPPGTPSGVSASDGSYCGFVRVTWNTAARATSYDVLRDGLLVASQPGTSFDSPAADTNAHTYAVVAENDCGSSSPASDTGFAGQPPQAPLGVSASDGTYSNFVRVVWGTVSSASSYEIWRATVNNPSSASKVSNPDPTGTTYDDYAISGEVTNYYWVKAVGACGPGAFSNPDSGYSVVGITNRAPNPPTNLRPVNGALGQPLSLLLEATAFVDPDAGDTHSASRWVVRRVGDGGLAFDSGVDVLNRTNIVVPSGVLSNDTAYAWLVSYRDNHDTWSQDSIGTTFTTAGPNGVGQLATNKWILFGAMHAPRYAARASVLKDGRVLITGGVTTGSTTTNLAEIFDPGSRSFQLAAPMLLPRSYHASVTLSDGRVLVAGGNNDLAGNLASCELYDPASNSWSEAGALIEGSNLHRLVRLESGMIFLYGGSGSGFGSSTCQLYDPSSNSWRSAGSLNSPRHQSGAGDLLADGRVLVAGGYYFSSTVESYDPSTDSWTPIGSLDHAVSGPEMVQLRDGRVLITGGVYWSGCHSVFNTTHIYNPSANNVIASAMFSTGRGQHGIVRLPGGAVLIFGGLWADGNCNTAALASSELFDPATDSWNNAASLNEGRVDFVWAQSGPELFVFGGWSGNSALASSEVYAPSLFQSVASPFQSGQMKVRVLGEPNRTVVLETSTDLHAWIPMVTNVLNNAGLWNFTDSVNSNGRFYRTVGR